MNVTAPSPIVAIHQDLEWFVTSFKGTERLEVRAFAAGKGKGAVESFTVVPGDIAEAAERIEGLVERKLNCYLGANPLRADYVDAPGRAGKGEDVTRRVHIVMDWDAVRLDSSNAPATRDELAHTMTEAKRVADELTRAYGFPEPRIGSSGNGARVIYRCEELPPEGDGRELVRSFLYAVAELYPTGGECELDLCTHDPSRVTRCMGTWNRKAKPTKERQDRQALCVQPAEDSAPVTREMLQTVIRDGIQPVEEPEQPPGTTWTKTAHDLNGNAGHVAAYIKAALDGECRKIEDTAEGSRHKRLIRSSRAVGGFLGFSSIVPKEEMARDLLAAARKAGLPEEEAIDAIAWGLKLGATQPRAVPNRPYEQAVAEGRVKPKTKAQSDQPPVDSDGRVDDGDEDGEPPIYKTELGNARRMVRKFGDRIRYCHALRTWYVWDGSRWKEDTNGAIVRLAKLTVRSIATEAIKKNESLQWALRSEARKVINSMIALAESEPGIPVEVDQWDADPWLLNCRNGTVDLRTGRIRPHDRNDLITRLCPVDYNPDARAPRWEQFEREIFAGDEDLIAYMRRTGGYALTALDEVQEINILHGGGSNGKNVWLDTVRSLMGDYADQAEPNLLLATGPNTHPTGVADLHGRRLITTSETEDGKKLAIALVKRLTGDQVIKARRMREDFFTFARTFKVFLATNCKPEAGDSDDHATWRRIRLVPFSVRFVKKGLPTSPPFFLAEDPGPMKKLKAEWPGILAILVRGCLEWRERGMDPPKAVTAATEEYRLESDTVASFLEERCDVPDDPDVRKQAKATFSTLLAAYEEHCAAEGVTPLKSKAFGAKLTNRGFASDKSNSKVWRIGLRLKSKPVPEPT